MRGGRRALASLVLAAGLAALAGCAPLAGGDDARGRYRAAWEHYAGGEYDAALALARAALEADRRAGRAAGVAEGLNLVGTVHYKRGDYTQALPVYEQAAAAAEAAGYAFGLGRTWSSLGSTHYRLGDYPRAQGYYEKSLAVRRRLGDPDEIARALNDLANVALQLGAYGRSLALREEALALWRRTGNTAGVADVLNDLGWVYDELGDYPRALGYLEQSLALSRRLGARWGVADGLDHTGLVLLKQGRARDALGRFRAALELFTALGSKDEQIRALQHAGEALHRLGDLAEAERAYTRAQALAGQILGPEHPTLAKNLNNLGVLYAAQGRPAAAEAALRRALAIDAKVLGEEHPAVAAAAENLAGVLAPRDPPAALALFERARRIHLALGRASGDLDEAAQLGLLRGGAGALGQYAELLATLARGPAARDAAARAFVVAEQLRGGVAQGALAKAGARAAAGDPATRELARRVEDLRRQRAAARTQLAEAYGAPAAAQRPARLEALGRRARALDAELRTTGARLERALPAYAELVAPAPADPAAVARLLRPGEALASYLVLEARVLVWLVRPDAPLAYREVAVPRAELARRVARVRASLDQRGNAGFEAGRLAPFDVAGAHALWRLLVAPLAPELVGVTHLLVVPDPLLLPLPFGALLTRAGGEPHGRLAALAAAGTPPEDDDLARYARLPWLARDVALTTLPSATALRVLRQGARRPAGPSEPLIGFGDPLLAGTGRERGGAMLAARGAAVAVEDLRQLARLPGTRAELGAVAAALGADPARALFLGERATKATVWALNASGRLGAARVLAFATHGLLAGQVAGLAQPALVLTPPAAPSEEDDGVLAVEDIVRLRLTRTEWVVLSACDTAAADGSGEGLSGLVRAFFFAGAPTLLVSHWSVDDDATRALMTEVFRRFAAAAAAPRAETLRRAMLALMDAAAGPTAYHAHPFAWAAFFLVGEGR